MPTRKYPAIGIVPRSPGLWISKRYSNKNHVEKAEAHLLELLSDPFYHEAYQRLLRKRSPLLAPRKGQLPVEKGKLAAKLQGPNYEVSGKRGGRPPKDFPKIDLILHAIETGPNQRSIADFCRRTVKSIWPKSSPKAVNDMARKLAQHVYNYKKKRSLGKTIPKCG